MHDFIYLPETNVFVNLSRVLWVDNGPRLTSTASRACVCTTTQPHGYRCAAHMDALWAWMENRAYHLDGIEQPIWK